MNGFACRMLFPVLPAMLTLLVPAFGGAAPGTPATATKTAATKTAPVPASPASPPAAATGVGFGGAGQNDRRPLDIEADQGIEWQQNANIYVARGNARATRGNVTVYADTLTAHYRNGKSAPLPKTAGAPAPKPAPAPAPKPASAPDDAGAPPGTPTGTPAGAGIGAGSDIYRVEAEGNVRIQTPNQTIYGDKGVYDLDTTVAKMTGKHLRLVTPRDTLTARDSLEWYDNRQIAVARGNAVAIREEKRVAGDVLVAQVTKTGTEAARVSRVDASGHVLVSTTGEIGRGDKGVYDVDKGVATLAGNVTLARGESTASGRCAVVDLNTNVSRLLSTCPGLAGHSGEKVKGLIMPSQKGASGQGEKR